MAEDKGHKNQEPQDAFELSDEEFEKAKATAGEQHAEEESEGTPDGNALEDNEPEDDKGQPEEEEEQPEKSEPFQLEEEKPPQDTEGEEEPTFEFVHKGVVQRVTKDKAVELIQKGYDYDSKVGPHARLVELINSDPEAQAVLDSHFRKKYNLPPRADAKPVEKEKPKMKPLKDFESEEEWLAANYEALREPRSEQASQQQAPQQAPAANVVQALNTAVLGYDPQESAEITPRLQEYWPRINVQDAQAIESSIKQGDFRPFLKFYDWVKGQVKPPPKRETPKPPFRTKSGGEPPKKQTSNVWELPKKDFRAIIDDAKQGY